MHTTETRVRKIIYDHLSGFLGQKFDFDFDWESDLREDLGADSLDIVELTMALEEEFEIEIADDEAENWRFAGDLLRTVQAKVGTGVPAQ